MRASLLAWTLALTLGLAADASAATVDLSTSQTDPVAGETVTYTANVSPASSYCYSFSVDDVPMQSGTSPDYTRTSAAAVGVTQTVTLSVFDSCQTRTYVGGASISVTTVPPLSGGTITGPDSGTVMQSLTYTVSGQSGGKAPLAVTWDIDDDGFDDGMGASITTSFTTSGTKNVRARIADSATPAHAVISTKTVTITGGGSPPPPPPPPPIDTTCLKSVAFGLVEITTGGCLRSTGTAAARYESGDAVKLNGIPFPAPPPGRKFVASAPTTADPGGRVGIIGTTLKLGSLTLVRGDIDWRLPAGVRGNEKTLLTLAVPGGQKLFGLSVGGSIAIKLGWRANGVHYASFPLNVSLPDVFKTGPTKSAGGATAAASIRTEESGIKYDGLKLQVSNVFVGKLKVESACFSFVPSGGQSVAPCAVPSLGASPFLTCNEDVHTDRWDGSAILQLPTASKTRLALFGGVANQRLSKLGGFVDHLGTSVPIVSGVYLSRVGVGLCVYPPPFKLKGDVGVNVLPVGGKPTIAVNGYFLYTDGLNFAPWSLELGGAVSVLERQVGSGKVTLRPTGSIDFSVQAHFSLYKVVSVDGTVVGWLEVPKKTFNVDGSVRSCLGAICAGTETVLSSTGVSGCQNLGSVTYFVLVRNSNFKWYAPWRVHWERRRLDFKAGFGHLWSSRKVALFGGSCQLGDYRAARGQAAAVRNGLVFDVAPRTPALALNVVGRTGPPKIKITGPGGTVVSSPTDAISAQEPGRYTLVENPTDGSTAVVLVNPKAGAWKVEALDGGTSLSGLKIAGFQPPASFTGTIVKRSKGRIALGVSYALPPGAKLDFVERGPQVQRTIARDVTGARRCPGPDRPGGQDLLCFRKEFMPAFGPGGRRSILAVVTRNGIPLSTTRVAGFTAPKPRLPSKPARLRVERRGSTVVLAFDRSADAASHTLSITLSTGRKFGVQPAKVSCGVVALKRIPRSVGVVVRVAGIRRDLVAGAYSKATLAAGKRRAGDKAKLPQRACASG